VDAANSPVHPSLPTNTTVYGLGVENDVLKKETACRSGKLNLDGFNPIEFLVVFETKYSFSVFQNFFNDLVGLS
jgi:hypothetical protein